MDFVVILLILSAVVAYVSGPLRAAAASEVAAPERTEQELRVAELEAAREAKYREIRDAELDHGTGKLSAEDFAELDATLRAEAVEILDALEREQGSPAAADTARG